MPQYYYCFVLTIIGMKIELSKNISSISIINIVLRDIYTQSASDLHHSMKRGEVITYSMICKSRQAIHCDTFKTTSSPIIFIAYSRKITSIVRGVSLGNRTPNDALKMKCTYLQNHQGDAFPEIAYSMEDK